MQEFKSSRLIDDFTIVWHPMIDGWKVLLHVKALSKVRREPTTEVLDCIEALKQANNLQPVFLKQGYLHLQRNHNKEQWKSRWLVMTKDSLLIHTIPKGRVKEDLKILEIDITLKTSQSKENGLVLEIKSISRGINCLFWSPFQKEILEWATELKKLKSLDKNAEPYIIKAECGEEETNLLVPLN